MTLKQAVEAIVFASQKPMMPREIATALRTAGNGSEDTDAKAFMSTPAAGVAALLEELKLEYTEQSRAFQLVEQVSGWQVVTRPEYGLWVKQLYPESKPVRLSGPALETLAIIGYRQPLTRADIEAVRGVAVDGVMQMLLDRGLVRIAGRAEVPGRPLLYETTQYFLEHFGLRSLDELPNSTELRRAALPTAAPAAAPEAPAPEAQLELAAAPPAEAPPPEEAPAIPAPEP